MIPFLKSIARGYASRYPDLSEFCFLFPNKRSGTFFLKYLKEECGNHLVIAPEVKTITEFVADISGRVVASRLDMIFLLYHCYRELRGLSATEMGDEEDLADFDSFRGWGETVISDFNEIDQYLVDADAVFKNVKDYREITSNFLTDEQKEVMAEYFGRTDSGDSSGFWKNFETDEENLSDVKKKFLYLWRSMSPLYEALNSKLAVRGIASSGGAYRLAVENLRSSGRDCLPFKKIVAVGFNALSASEAALFSEMRDFDGYPGYDSFCDFFWDATGPVLSEGINSASRFVKANIKAFPSPQWAFPALEQSDVVSLPDLKIVASPSNSAQVKIAGLILADMRKKLSSKEISEARVAVVLPDENLLLPMLYSLPEGMGSVNLTMGYPLKLTSVVPFVRQLRLLYRNRRLTGESAAFYHKDLRLFLSHPFSHAVFGTAAVNHLIGFMDSHHKAVLSLDDINVFSHDAAEMLDFSILDTNPDKAIELLDSILSKVIKALPDNGSGMMKSRLEIDHIEVYRDALRRLSDLLDEYKIRATPHAVYHLVDKLLSGSSVGFEGEPLTGLQIMGTLETRSLDFDHLIILSMNERIMPLRARTRSFIPDSLRHAFGMPPSNYAESIFAYYFYRMISRAKDVTMIYDARTGGGLRSGDVSRYVLQLRHLFAKGVLQEQGWKFQLSGKMPYDPAVEKSDDIKERLKDFMSGCEKSKNFSASALNTYRECQVRFFYQYVMGINTDPDKSEFIDAIGVGNILHALMEHIYLPENMRKKYLDVPMMINKETLESLIADKDRLLHITTRIVNKEHFRLSDDKLDTPLSGAAEIVGRQIIDQAIRVMKRDIRIAPFKIYGCEIKETIPILLKSGKVVNFKFAIDRLDEIMVDGKPRMRIVDYKTGRIKLEADSMEEVLNGDYRSEQVFQLLTYAWLLDKLSKPCGNDVRLEIYDVPRIFKFEENLPKIGGETISSYKDCSDEFSKGIEEMIESVFSDARFEAAEDERTCGMCRLRMLCRR